MQIEIALISVDVSNFRHDQAKTEREAMRFLLNDEKTHKVAELAQDIVDQGGLDPSSLLIVTQDPDDNKRYVALEGNRRITALKALMTPDLAADTPAYAKLKSLNGAFAGLGITAVECVVLDRAKASVWIKRKHYKGMGGAGVVAWNAVATARSDASEGRYSRWMTALAFLEKHGIDAEQIRDSIAGKTTTIERVWESVHVSTVLGLTFGKDGTLTAENGDEVAAAKLVWAMMEAMSDRSFIEPTVSTSDQQLGFINQFASLNVKKPVPPPSQPAAGATGAGAPNSPPPSAGSTNTSGGGTGNSNSNKASSGTSGGTGTRAKSVKLRKHLADSGLRISHAALNKFYWELKSLNVEKSPHVAAAIVRVFLEKASTVFLEEMQIPPLNTKVGATWHDFDVKLRSKVDAVLKNIDSSGNNPKLAYARDVANGNIDKLHTADHLNQSIHSHHSLPSHGEIITIWDRFHPYFWEMFEAIEKKNKP